MSVPARLGSIWTFYSYKGGVGRSLALANVAAQLSSWGYRVLCVDWDLEAPGLHLFFDRYTATRVPTPGIVELISEHAGVDGVEWRECLTEVSIPNARGHLDLIRAGRMDGSYVARVQELDWERLYADAGLGTFLEALRIEWAGDYHFVLVDSRTGITDIGGVCTVQLPDFLAVMFTANDQSILGALDVARRANDATAKLPFDRPRLPTIPIVSRFEGNTEVELARRWLTRIEEEIADVVSTWLDRTVTVGTLLNHIKVPYVPHWSFGERLPVIEEGTGDPLSIGYAFETIAALVAHGLEQSSVLATSRSSYVETAARVAPADGTPIIEDFEFDVFVSYDRVDKSFGEALMQALSDRGLRVRSETAEVEAVADSSAITDGLARSRNMVAVVGVEPTKWMETEYRQFLLNSLSSGSERLFVPVLLVPDAVGALALAQYRSVDASTRSPAEVADQLAPVLSGRGWPVRIAAPVEAASDGVSEQVPIALQRIADQSKWHLWSAQRGRVRRFIVSLLSATALASAVGFLIAGAVGSIPATLAYSVAGGAVAFATAVTAIGLLVLDVSRSREAIHIKTANLLEREKVFFAAGADAYAESEDPAVLLTERVERILSDAELALRPTRRRAWARFGSVSD